MDRSVYIDMARTEKIHFWYRGRAAIIKSIISSLHLPVNSKILEVGCGTGGNLDMLSFFGVVDAFEMDDEARKIATKKSNGLANVVQGVCPHAIPFQDKRYDLICAFDVLEHIMDDRGTLQALHAMLANKGYLLITVPAYQWMYGQEDIRLHHFRRYGKSEVAKKFSDAGYSVLKLTSINMFLFPVVVITRFMENFTKRSLINAHSIPGLGLNDLLRAIFSSEKSLIRFFNLPFGVSILCLAKKVESKSN